MIIKKKDRKLEVDEDGIQISDYDLSPLKSGLSYQELNGRGPKSGAGINMVWEECYCVIEGSIKVTLGDQEFDAETGGVVIIPAGSTSFLEAEDAKILTFTNPDWYAEQHKKVL